MTPKEALDRVRTDPADADAWTTLQAELVRLVARVDEDPQLRADAVRAVRAKLEDKVLAGDLDPIAAPASYLKTSLRNFVIDRKRRAKAAHRASERAAECALAAQAQEEPPIPGDLLALLQRVYEKARSRRDAWQRDHLERAWPQILALHTESVTLRQLVVRDEGLDAGDEEAVRLAVQRAHTAHRRTRSALAEALDAMLLANLVDAGEAAEARRALQRLKRRQDRAPSRVTRGDGP